MRDGPRLTIAGAAYLIDDPGDVLGKAYIEILRFPSADGDYDRREGSEAHCTHRWRRRRSS